jgi:hypothetical protein
MGKSERGTPPSYRPDKKINQNQESEQDFPIPDYTQIESKTLS